MLCEFLSPRQSFANYALLSATITVHGRKQSLTVNKVRGGLPEKRSPSLKVEKLEQGVVDWMKAYIPIPRTRRPETEFGTSLIDAGKSRSRRTL